MTTVTGKLIGWTSGQRVEMKATLVDVTGAPAVGYVASVPGELVRPATITPDSDGVWSADLTPNALIASDAGDTLWAIQEGRAKDGTPLYTYVVVPATGGPYWAGDIRAALADTVTGVGTVVYLPGPEGPAGADGAPGTPGAPGADGQDGASAYELAVAGGFTGTEAEWLASLEGPQGDIGPAGPQPPLGAAGAGPAIALQSDDPTTTDSRRPSGPAGGDLSGMYPNPAVAKVNGVEVTGTPAAGTALVATGATAASWSVVASSDPWVFDVTATAYGAKGDGKVVADGAMTSGSATMTSATAAFTAADVGKAISVKGAAATGVTTLATTIAAYVSATQVTLATTAATSVTGAVVIWGTDDTAAIQAAVDAAEAYLTAGHTYAQVFFPPRPYIVAGALSSAKSGNGQIVFGPVATTANKRILEFRGETDGAAAVRHWQQTVPQFAGSCLISLGVYSSTSAQITDLNAHGNPAVICGPNEGSGYGVAANFSNMQAVVKNLAILTTHSSFGLTYGALNLYGVANASVENLGYGTAGTVASPSTDYTSPGVFGTGLSVGLLLPAPGNNDHVIARNISCGGGYTYAMFLTEHAVVDRYMALYCWAGLCAVGTYAGSVGSVHAMKVLSASIEACTNELYIVGAGSSGVGPIIDIDQLSTENSTPNIAGNSTGAMNAALGKVRLTGLFNEAGVSVSAPTGIELINGQAPAAIKRKTAAFTCSPIDRTLICDTTSGGFTGTLPAADFNPVEYAFKNVGSNSLTVGTTSSQLIYTGSGAGAATVTVASGQTLRVQALYNGSAWAWYALSVDGDSRYLQLAGGTVTGDLDVAGRLSTAGWALPMLAPSGRRPRWRAASWRQIFATGHGWTGSGSGVASTADDTALFCKGTQSFAMTTTGTAAVANMRRYGAPAVDLTGKALRLTFRVSDVSKLNQLNFLVGTSSLANSYSWRLFTYAGTAQNQVQSGEWVTVTLQWAGVRTPTGTYTVGSTGIPSTTSGITDMSFQVVDNGTGPVTVNLQSVEVIPDSTTTFPTGAVSITFDDCYSTVWSNARPKLDGLGYRGTIYTIADVVDSSGTYLTRAQMRAMQDSSGWEIAGHSYTAASHNAKYTTLSTQTVLDELRNLRAWMVDNGFQSEHFAYPGGWFGPTTNGDPIDQLTAKYFTSGRGISSADNAGETFPPGMAYRMRSVSGIGSLAGGASPANPTNLLAAGGPLDRCAATGQWLILTFHEITTGTATTTNQCSLADFNSIIDGINSRGITVLPVSDAMRYYS